MCWSGGPCVHRWSVYCTSLVNVRTTALESPGVSSRCHSDLAPLPAGLSPLIPSLWALSHHYEVYHSSGCPSVIIFKFMETMAQNAGSPTTHPLSPPWRGLCPVRDDQVLSSLLKGPTSGREVRPMRVRWNYINFEPPRPWPNRRAQ